MESTLISAAAILISIASVTITLRNAKKNSTRQCKCAHARETSGYSHVTPASTSTNTAKVVYFTEGHEKKLQEDMENQ